VAANPLATRLAQSQAVATLVPALNPFSLLALQRISVLQMASAVLQARINIVGSITPRTYTQAVQLSRYVQALGVRQTMITSRLYTWGRIAGTQFLPGT
jgi:hypothetical protein